MSNAAVAAIIPARWGSTRFPGKALHLIGGKPLIQHVWEQARRASMISQVIIATDDQRIITAANDFGAEVALTSPQHQSGTDRIAEVAARLPGITHVINVQGDEPLIAPDLLNELANTLVEDPSVEMVTAANRFAPTEDVRNPNAVKVVLNQAGNALYFSRSPIPHHRDADSPAPIYYRHQGLYGYSLPFLLRFVSWPVSPLEQAEQLEQLRALDHGATLRVIITEHASVGVDTPSDAATVAALLAQRAQAQSLH